MLKMALINSFPCLNQQRTRQNLPWFWISATGMGEGKDMRQRAAVRNRTLGRCGKDWALVHGAPSLLILQLTCMPALGRGSFWPNVNIYCISINNQTWDTTSFWSFQWMLQWNLKIVCLNAEAKATTTIPSVSILTKWDCMYFLFSIASTWRGGLFLAVKIWTSL